MKKRMYVDVHVIHTVPPSCVNRDDTGSPKTAHYGGVRRARVSSQSWKKAMRDHFHERFDEKELAFRTKKIVDLVVERMLAIDSEVSVADAEDRVKKVLETGGVKLGKKSKKEGEEDASKETAALFFMSYQQSVNLAKIALSDEKYNKKDVQNALNSGCGVEIALFGRMVADDPSLNADASSQVAHSISTHKVENEYDYFTAMDDRAPEDNAGAGMIGTVEFNSSTLYRYATVAVHDLHIQLGSDPEVTAKAVAEFIRAFTLSMPTGKQNTFANRTIPDMLQINVRTDQPINMAGAFESPVMKDEAGGFKRGSIKRFFDYEKTVYSSFASMPDESWKTISLMDLAEDVHGDGEQDVFVDLNEALEGIGHYLQTEL